jgi:hypothetical protein
MTVSEAISHQAALAHARFPETKIGVYRNGIKAVNIFAENREKLNDPQFSGWFGKTDGAESVAPTTYCYDAFSHASATDWSLLRQACASGCAPHSPIPRVPEWWLAKEPLVQGCDAYRPVRERSLHHATLHLREVLRPLARYGFS